MTAAGGPLTVWTGWDGRGRAAPEPIVVEAFARSGSPHDPDADERYELLAVAARGFRPPGLLSAVHIVGQEADGPKVAAEAGWEIDGLRPTWSLLYRQVVETGPALVAPHAIYLLGVNPPDGATTAELETFNEFYTNVHMPEVAERRHALRAVRYELLREVRPPYQGAPQFLAVYEVDEKAASNRRHKGPPYATGPSVWQRHTTPWRLWYRRLPAPEGA